MSGLAPSFPLRKGIVRTLLPAIITLDAAPNLILCLLCGGGYPDGRWSYLITFSVFEFSIWSSFADLAFLVALRSMSYH
jgi:hypothetical protein